jgi:hypothetical protein
MSTDSESGSGSGSESDTERMDAGEMWRSQAFDMLNTTTQLADEGSRNQDISFKQTVLEFEEKRKVQVLTIDSLHRDQRIFPNPLSFRIKLPRIYKNISRIDIVQIKMLSGLYCLTAAKGNTTLTLYDVSENRISVTIPDGTYTPPILAETLTKAINAVSRVGAFKIVFNVVTNRFVITGPSSFRMPFYSELTDPQLQVAYLDWGLGWNMGFGGQPIDLSGLNVHTATYIPRLKTDYIHLRLNDNDNMNTIDNTDLENLSLYQDTTGQTDHYFGKLLLNDFGGYAQTFIESPKLYQPVLSRLDRLAFDWVDRYGNALAGPDSLSCDWHMTLRIIEVIEVPKDSSTLIRNI